MMFPRFDPSADIRPPAESATQHGNRSGAGLRVEWLGTAGFVVSSASTTVMIDPYLSRLPLPTLAASPLVPDEKVVRARLPTRVDAVLCGHSHFDHLLDAPLIARITGAKLVGSRTTRSFGIAAGVAPEQLVEIGPAGGETTIGDLQIRFVSSLHAKILLGSVPFPGEVAPPAPKPARAWQYRMGGAYGILIRAPGATLYHNGSADLVDATLAGLHADILLVGIVGRKHASGYVPRLLRLLEPSVVVPAHHDAFFAPFEEGVRLLPGVDVEGFVADVRRERPNVQIAAPLYDEPLVYDSGRISRAD
ncbi:MAG TPA: MBL fold metallo-hydrolase [Polyangiaceae bacterium]|jgi:L-ascorbate metabolism protein UlaG (beta-lactamase superfamily)